MKKFWFREFDGWWYVTLKIDGKRVQKKLVKGQDARDEAEKRYHRLMLDVGQKELSQDVCFKELADVFLDACQEENDSQTYAWYKNYLQSFCDHYLGSVRELKPLHVNKWLSLTRKKPWSVSTRRQAITCVKRVVNWALDEGYIDFKPLSKLKRPKMARRKKLISSTEHEAIIRNADPAFREFLTALSSTGARPGEVRRVTADMVDVQMGLWVFQEHKTAHHTGEPRIVYLTPAMLALSEELMKKHPRGPLFRNSQGQPWTVNAVRCRMRRLRAKLGLAKGTVAYAYRHTFTTEGLQRGVPIAEMAVLLNHKDLSMIQEHYGHLTQRTEHMRKAAKRATGDA